MLSKRLFVFILITLLCVSARSQGFFLETEKNLNYRQSVTPVALDNYQYSTFYGAGKKGYNLRGFNISKAPYEVLSVKVNPAGISYAILCGNGKKSYVGIYDSNEINLQLHEFSDVKNATAIAYSADSRDFFIATSASALFVYDSKTYAVKRSIDLPFAPTMMATSPNGYYIVIAASLYYAVIDLETGEVRVSEEPGGKIRDIAFSADSERLGVLSDLGCLYVYDTRTFYQTMAVEMLGDATSFSFHPDGKYVSFAADRNSLLIVDLTDTESRCKLVEPDGGVSYVRFLRDGKFNIYLTYNSLNSIKYKLLKGFTPNYTKMLRDELSMRMDEWAEMRDGETFEEYRLRVNDETRITQARLLEQEIATRMADNAVMNSSISLGGYNLENGMLTLDFDNMPSIVLDVPQEEVADFMSSEDLEFQDAVYGLANGDKFELIYAKVYNKKTGKYYEFNNLDRASLDQFLSSDDFVAIELVRQSSMEEVKLNSIRQDIVTQAKLDNLISDHTDIQVNTSVVPDVNAFGKKITNYKVAFKYQVDSEFSVQEDFPAGKYAIEDSHAAESMLKIVKKAFETDFAAYIKEGKKLIVNITGSADALPINRVIPYDGSYGDFENEPYTLDRGLSSMTVTRSTGIKKNEQLAFIRAAAVRDYIQNNVSDLASMNITYNNNVELSDERGGAYRRISVEFIFIDAF